MRSCWTVVLLVLHVIRATLALSATGAVPPPLSQREAGVRLVIESLYGSESSARAVARQDVSEQESRRRFESARFKELTYGEFDLDFFFALLRDAEPAPGERFCDVGSGCGRLVAAAALLHEWECAAGVEVLDDLHELGSSSLTRLEEALAGGVAEEIGVKLAPCSLLLGEADELLPHFLREPGDAAAPSAVVFIYATCWPSAGPYLASLSKTLAESLPSGSRVITIDKQLLSEPGEWSFTLQLSREMPNYNTHASVGYVYRLEPPPRRDTQIEQAGDQAATERDGMSSQLSF